MQQAVALEEGVDGRQDHIAVQVGLEQVYVYE